MESPSGVSDVQSFYLNTQESGLISILDGWLMDYGDNKSIDKSEINVGSLATINKEIINLDEKLHRPIDFLTA